VAVVAYSGAQIYNNHVIPRPVRTLVVGIRSPSRRVTDCHVARLPRNDVGRQVDCHGAASAESCNQTHIVYQVIIQKNLPKVNRMFSGKWGKLSVDTDKNRRKLQKSKKIFEKTLVKTEKTIYSLTARAKLTRKI